MRTRLNVMLYVHCLSCYILMIQKRTPHREADMWVDASSHFSAVRKLISCQLVQRHSDMLGQSEITTDELPSAGLFRLYMTNRRNVA